MILSLGLLLLVVVSVSLISGQQAGISLMFQGETIPSDSFVDLDDVLNIGSGSAPTNRNPRSNEGQGAALECITDLVDCCGTESDAPPGIMRTERGDWYFPDGTTVGFGGGTRFLVNRGPNEVINGQQFYGSVRLFRRFSAPPERGRFRCELPSAADPNTNLTLYINILQFGVRFDVDHVIFSPSTGSTTTTAGQRDYSLTCSSTLFELDRIISRSDVPSPNFQWSFNGSTSLPSGVTAMPTVMSSSNSSSETYTSTLQFSRLSQSLHTGMYTCRLGPGRLENSDMVTVNALPISAVVTANLNTPLMVGQTDNTLTCVVSGADNLTPTIAYQWTRDGVTVQSSSSNTFNFSPLRLSLAGVYTCSASVTSNLLNSAIQVSASNNQTVTIEVPDPQAVIITSGPDNIVLCGSTVTVNCTIELDSIILESDLSLLNVSAEISRNGTILTQTSQSLDGTTFNFGATVNFFSQSDIGNYVCTATITPLPSFLTGMSQRVSEPLEIIIGLPPAQGRGNTRCSCGGDIAIAVVVLILIECLLAAPVITAVMVICWKRNQRKLSHVQYKSTSDAIVQSGEVHPGEVVYEDPDRTAATTTPGEFKLTECPAYVTTTASSPQPTTEAQFQSGYYEL